VAEPWLGGHVSLADRAADQLGEHVVLALEVEVEAAPGDLGRREDVGNGDLVEAVLGEEPAGGLQDHRTNVALFAPGRLRTP
jgi:hypothetical protein